MQNFWKRYPQTHFGNDKDANIPVKKKKHDTHVCASSVNKVTYNLLLEKVRLPTGATFVSFRVATRSGGDGVFKGSFV